jgi:DNA-binding IclR family transcriptional regulator
MPEDTSRRIDAVSTSVAVLDAIVDGQTPTLSDIAERLDLAPGTVHPHLQTLEAENLVRRADSGYTIGIGAFEYGGLVRDRYRQYLTEVTELDELAASTGHVGQVAIEEDGQCTYVYQTKNEARTVAGPRLGEPLGFHCSAVGKALLSTRSEDAIREQLQNASLESHTPRTEAGVDVLLEEILQAKAEGLAFDFEEQFESVVCVATPVVFQDGTTCAISLSADAEAVSEDVLRTEIADGLYEAGRTIEADVKYSNWT